MKRWVNGAVLLVFVASMTLLMTGCAAGTASFSVEEPAGFWMGLWHGAISVITLIIHVFNQGIRVYEVNNTGGWYDFGFLLGVICIWGGCSSVGCHHSRKCRRDRDDDDEWDEVGGKVEQKVKRKLRQWAEANPDEDWDAVEKKLENKLRDKLRKWAESDD